MKKGLALVLLLIATVALAAPVPQNRDDEKAIPDLSGEWHYGRITQTGRTFTINGLNEWSGIGKIRDDGKVVITWFRIETMIPSEAVYQFNGDNTLRGLWQNDEPEDDEDKEIPDWFSRLGFVEADF